MPRDLRFALRELLEHRGFTVVALLTLTLALGLGPIAAGAENWPRFRGPNGSGVSWRTTKMLTAAASPLCYRGLLCLVKNGGLLASVDKESGEILRRMRDDHAYNDFLPAALAFAHRALADADIFARAFALIFRLVLVFLGDLEA